MIDNFVGGYLNFLVIFVCLAVCSPVTALIALAAALLSWCFMLTISHYSRVNAPVEAQANRDMTGAVMDPFAAYLILRGLKTLEIRMERHCANAKAIAEFLDQHPAVEKVYYPGLKNHVGHDIAVRQMKDFGGMLSFEVKGGRAAGTKLVNALHLITVAVSLGDAETLIEHPASMTHSTYTEEELAASGIPGGLIRLSAGLENAEDIIADLEQALAQL